MENSKESRATQFDRLSLEINFGFGDLVNKWMTVSEGECSLLLIEFLEANNKLVYKQMLEKVIAKAKSEYLHKSQRGSYEFLYNHIRFLKKNPTAKDYIDKRVISTFPRLIRGLILLVKRIDQAKIQPRPLVSNTGSIKMLISKNFEPDIQQLVHQVFDSFLIYLEADMSTPDEIEARYAERLGKHTIPELVKSFAKVYMRAKTNHSDSRKRIALSTFYKIVLNTNELFLPDQIMNSAGGDFVNASDFVNFVMSEAANDESLAAEVNAAALRNVVIKFVQWLQISSSIHFKRVKNPKVISNNTRNLWNRAT